MSTALVPVNSARLCVVLVTNTGWEDTLECLESLMHSTMPLRVILVDTGSGDGGVDRIVEWAQGRLQSDPAAPSMAAFSEPPTRKPIELVVYDTLSAATEAAATPSMAIVGGDGVGQAAATNIGLEYGLRDPRLEHFWILTSDTIVEPGAAASLVMRLRATHRAGLCGTVIRRYFEPNVTESLNGGTFSRLTGRIRKANAGQPAAAPFDAVRISRASDYVDGHSFGASRNFFTGIGPLNERLNGAFAQIDLAERNHNRFVMSFAHGAIVYRKGDASSADSAADPSADYDRMRARLLYVRRWHPLLLPWHWAISLLMILRALLRARGRSAGMMIKALFGRDA
jgi:GT2 family glycosyltransferase